MRRLYILALVLASQTMPFGAISQQADPALGPFVFLSGRWTSDSADGQEEEYWSQASGRSMVGHFRVVKDSDAVFYEFWVVEVEDGRVVLKMKHFDRGLLGWEEKADMVRLVASVGDGQNVLFSKPDGSLSLRYQRNGDELVSTLRRVKDGKTKEDVFHLHRSKE